VGEVKSSTRMVHTSELQTMTQYKQDILDIETDFQCEVEEFVRQDKDFSEIYALAMELLSTDKYKDLKLNDQYHENCIYDLVSEMCDRYHE
jgi:hypothetical protein